MARRRAPRWYFSFRSPYSWMAYRDLTDRYPDVADAIDWLPFWEPDEPTAQDLTERGIRLPYVPMSREKHLYILQDVRRLARERDLDMVWPQDPDPNWEVSHLAYLVANRLGHGRPFIDAVYRARWEQGKDISDPAVMATLATGLGLDPEPFSNAATDPAVRAEGLASIELLHRDGVFGVPYFIDGFDKYWGVDRLPAFVSRIRAQHLPPELLTTATVDQGHAGGCG
ncbi:isomerase [Streptomyces sp. HC44]|uniref:2-hydroxychromene-2-carboxylate isomerase n=1 Tax=Streptomyces scabichelini TaxID=2711217 RepID=A0A6G4VF11_9ACTN|nr:DsbA family protein [Streptomyces scabichelini]NGO12394.1 isomerase [Streptomyces scabichelini]